MAFLRRSRSTRASHDVSDGLVVRQFPAPIRRSRFASWWDGWRAVRAGVHQRELLSYRLAQYLALAPQNRQPLPRLVVIDGDGRVAVEDNPDAERHPLARLLDDPAGVREAGGAGPLEAQVRWLRAMRETRAWGLARELQEREEEAGGLTARILETGDRLGELEAGTQAAIGEGTSALSSTAARTAEARGRDRLTFPWGILGLALVAAFFVVAEGYQFALPYLNTIGIDTARLGGSARLGLVAGFAFAAVATASMFIVAHWAYRALSDAARGGGDAGTRVATALGALAMGGLILATVLGIAEMRDGLAAASARLRDASVGARVQGAGAAGGATPAYLFPALGVAVLVALVRLGEWIRAMVRERRRVREEQSAWDAAEEGRLSQRDRHEELARRASRQREALEAAREAAREKLRALNAEAQAAEQEVRTQVETERRYAAAFVGSLVAALEQDRQYFLRHARRRGAEHLAEPQGGSRAGAWEPEQSGTYPALFENGGHESDPRASPRRSSGGH